MNGFIPNQLLDKILLQCDIVEIIQSYFPLKRSGRNLKALCPFHTEKTPSFMVSPEKQIYKCFGCGKGGNVFHFLMEKEHIGFYEAVKIVADKLHIQLPTKRDQYADRKFNKEDLYAAISFALSFYHKNLINEKIGKKALDYFKNRGIKKESIEKFKLGYAPSGWDSLLSVAKKKNYSIDILEIGGLILKSETSESYYDRFRDRIIFPIFDPQGKTIGFSGRVLDDSLPKYINSPETPLFNKSSILYGINFSREKILQQKKAIVCEGPIDFITAFQAGIQNVVASQGTSFTTQQARLLKRYTTEAIFAFDSDTAGQKATIRSFDPLVENGLDVKVAIIPAGYDPDKLIREKGPAQFKKIIDSAIDLLDFHHDFLRKEYDDKTDIGKLKIASEILVSIKKVPSPILQDERIRKLANKMNIREEILRLEAKKIRGDYTPFAEKVNLGLKREFSAEKEMIGYFLNYAEVVQLAKEKLSPDDFRDLTCREIMKIMFALTQKNKELKAEQVLSRVQDADQSKLITQIMLQWNSVEKPVEAADELIQKILEPKKLDRMKQLKKIIDESSKTGKQIDSAIFEEYTNLKKSTQKIK